MMLWSTLGLTHCLLMVSLTMTWVHMFMNEYSS